MQLVSACDVSFFVIMIPSANKYYKDLRISICCCCYVQRSRVSRTMSIHSGQHVVIVLLHSSFSSWNNWPQPRKPFWAAFWIANLVYLHVMWPINILNSPCVISMHSSQASTSVLIEPACSTVGCTSKSGTAQQHVKTRVSVCVCVYFVYLHTVRTKFCHWLAARTCTSLLELYVRTAMSFMCPEKP